MEQEENKNKIQEINTALYSKNANGVFVKKRHDLKEDYSAEKLPSAWENSDENMKKGFQLSYSKILLLAFVFFILATGFAAYKFFGGSNTVSGNNIDVSISGPVSVSGGDELALEIKIKNNNSLSLSGVDLLVEYPDGTKSSKDLSIDQKRYSENIGEIVAGGSESRMVKAVLYGEENSKKAIKVTVSYRMTGSNSMFSKEKEYTVLLSSSPISIKVTNPDEINADQQTDFVVEIKSSSLKTIKNLILKAEYPFGFNFVSSNPKADSSDGSLFVIGDLEPGGNRTIKITGLIQGQEGEERVVKFSAGLSSDSDKKSLVTILASNMSEIFIKKAYVGVTASIDGNTNNEVAISDGDKINTDIAWQNNLSEKINNLIIKVAFSGQLFDKTSVNTSNGFYRSLDNAIVFDKTNIPDFAAVGSNENGNVSFSFNTYSYLSNSNLSFSNSNVVMNITVLGNRSGSATQDTLYSSKKVLKISSSLDLRARGFRSYGPFENTGPFPPKVDKESTYTIIWTVTDSFNNMNNVKVSATLPSGVKWTGYTSPSSEKISYDQNTGLITWDVGNLKSGVGSTYEARDVAFQVAVTPSLSQVGFNINLLGDSTVIGTDSYSLENISQTKSAVTTNITSDPEYFDGIGKVVQ